MAVIFDTHLYTYLSAIPQLGSHKVFPMAAIQDVEPPYVVYVTNDGVEQKTLEGYSDNKTITMEIHCIHTTFVTTRVLAAQVLNVIKNFQSVQLDADIYVQNVTYEYPMEGYDPDINRYRALIQAKISY